jgi:hypothetical protein
VNWHDVAATLKLVGKGIWSVVKILGRAVELVLKLDSALRALPQPPSWVSGTTPGSSVGGIKPPSWVRGADTWVSDHVRGLFGTSPSKGAAPGRTLPPVNRNATPRAPGNAKISLHVTTDRGVSVAPTRMKASGLDVSVTTGRAMGPFA